MVCELYLNKAAIYISIYIYICVCMYYIFFFFKGISQLARSRETMKGERVYCNSSEWK